MMPIGPATRIFLAAGATDLRKSFEGLSDLVTHHFQADPLSGHLYVFTNRKHNRIKMLYADGTGVWVCAKRLCGQGTFAQDQRGGGLADSGGGVDALTERPRSGKDQHARLVAQGGLKAGRPRKKAQKM